MKALNGAKGFDESLLRQIRGIFTVGAQVIDDAEETFAIPPDEVVISRDVARLHPFNEQRILIALREGGVFRRCRYGTDGFRQGHSIHRCRDWSADSNPEDRVSHAVVGS